MNATRNIRGRRPRWVALCLLAAGLAPFAAAAQSWEVHSGLNPHKEVLRGVVDVRYCPGGGMASVGAQEMPLGTPGGGNIIVERVYAATPLGAPSWRYSYDSGHSEYGGGIVEYTDGSGFAIVASRVESTSPQLTRLTISKIDCNGNMVWHRGYGMTAGYNVSWDIIRANTGTPALGTNPGDLVAVGEYSVSGLRYVRVVRAENTMGNLIWTRDYSMPTGVPTFGRGIAEVDTPSTTDHLVVAGGLGANAAIFEVDGDTGLFVCGTQSPGLGGGSIFNDIVRHGGTTGIAPGFTAVGDTRLPTGAPSQAYVASYVTGPTAPCALKKQVHWGTATDHESAQAVTTTLGGSFSAVPTGQLLIAGNVVGPYSTNPNSADVWTHLMVPNTLTPFVSATYTGQRYGTFAAGLSGAETVADVAESTGGGYFVGMSTSPWVAGDPQYGYSTRMRFSDSRTLCSVPWKAPITALASSSAFVLADPRYDPSVWLHPLPRSPIKADFCCNYSPL